MDKRRGRKATSEEDGACSPEDGRGPQGSVAPEAWPVVVRRSVRVSPRSFQSHLGMATQVHAVASSQHHPDISLSGGHRISRVWVRSRQSGGAGAVSRCWWVLKFSRSTWTGSTSIT